MTTQEFDEWQVMYRKEGWMPVHTRAKLAHILGGLMQGPSTRRDGQPWLAAHFMAADPWSTPTLPAAPTPRRVNIAQHAHAHNARRRGRG